MKAGEYFGRLLVLPLDFQGGEGITSWEVLFAVVCPVLHLLVVFGLCSEATAGALLLVKMESLLRISGRSQMVWLGATTSETFSGMMRPRSLLMPRLRCSMSALRDALRTSSTLPRPMSISDWERVCKLAVRANVDERTETSGATDLRGNVLQYVPVV